MPARVRHPLLTIEYGVAAGRLFDPADGQQNSGAAERPRSLNIVDTFDAALIGAAIGGAFALFATFLAHLLESRREWRGELRRQHLELRSAFLRAGYPIFSSDGERSSNRWSGLART
jgi:hypothetical protein